MNRIFRWSSSRPRLALFLAVLVTALLGSGIALLKVDPSLERLLSPDDPRVVYHEEVRTNFADRPVILAVARTPGLLTPATLEHLHAYGEALAETEGIEKVTSLFNTLVPQSDGSVLRGVRLLDAIPQDHAAVAALRERLLGNSLIRGNLLNEAGDAALFYLYPAPGTAEVTSPGNLLERLDRLTADFNGRQPDTRLSLVGVPVVKAAMERNIRADLTVLGPYALLVVGVLIFVFYRSLTAVFLPLITGVLGAVGTLGFMGYAGFEISIFLSTIVVLVIVLGCTEDLHILSDYFDNIGAGVEKIEAIRQISRTSGLALFLTATTTVLSFVSIGFTGILGLRHFAISCAFGMAFNFLVTVLVVPAMLALLPVPKAGAKPSACFAGLADLLQAVFLHHRTAALIALGGLVLVAGIGASRLVRDTDYITFFSDRSSVVQDYRGYAKAFGGGTFVTVTFETSERKGVEKPDNLLRILRLRDFLHENGGHAFGYIDLLTEFQIARGKGAVAPDRLPAAEDLAIFSQSVPSDFLAGFVDYDGSRTAIRLRVEAPGAIDVIALEDRILDFARSEFGDAVEIRVTGDRVVLAHLSDLVTSQLITSLVILSGLVALLISTLLRSPGLGLVAIVPNLFPIITTFGAMGWLGIPLSVGTFPVAVVAFGIAVDDTIHFMVRYHVGKKAGLSETAAVCASLHRELRPILATSVIVATGYLVMATSPFQINRDVGILFAIASAAALVADLILTPILLNWRRGKPVSDAR